MTASIPLVSPPSGPTAPQPPQSQPQAGTPWPGQPQQTPSAPLRQPSQPQYPTGGQPAAGTPSGPMPSYPSGPQPGHPSWQQPQYPTGGQPAAGTPSGPQQAPKIYRSPPAPPGPASDSGGLQTRRMADVPPAADPGALETGRVSGDATNIATSMMKILRPGRTTAGSIPGAIKIGRANDNDIVIPEVLASRHHATLISAPTGTEIHDNRSINGTFVNGARVDSALLHEGDVVTIGNIDLVFADGTLARRDEAATATRGGGLDVRGVTWTIESTKTLLDDISLGALPGTLTAVIGPSGAGKSTFARLVAGYTQPDHRHGGFRGPQCARRVRLAAQQDRHGAAGRRGARPADRATGTDVCRRTAAATGHHQG